MPDATPTRTNRALRFALILLMMLMVFHAIGALVFIPALVSLLKPKFAIKRAQLNAAAKL